jgi:hypothetical protein
MSRWRLAASVLAATVLGISGCGESTGSSKHLTRAELIARGDVICRRLSTKLAATATGEEGGGLAQLLLALAVYEHAVVAEMRKLTPPVSMADGWGQMVSGAQTLAGATAKLGEYEQAHNDQLFNPSPTRRAVQGLCKDPVTRTPYSVDWRCYFFLFWPFLCFEQSFTLIGVDWCITAPFWAVNAVGTFSPPLTLQRLVLAARAELAPCGSFSSNVPIGTSGTWRNVELVMPAFEMNVSPCNCTVVP